MGGGKPCHEDARISPSLSPSLSPSFQTSQARFPYAQLPESNISPKTKESPDTSKPCIIETNNRHATNSSPAHMRS